MRVRHAALAVVLLSAFELSAAPAAVNRELQVFDMRLYSELQRINPAAVPLFAQANREREAGQHDAAARDYAKVVELALPRVVFEVEVTDDIDTVGKSKHIRFVVDKAKQGERLKRKAEKVKATKG